MVSPWVTGGTNYDWPMTMLYYGPNVSVANVKSLVHPFLPGGGDQMWGLVNNGGGFVWDSDEGKKSHASTCGTSTHMRVYAPGSAYLDNWFLGRYVVVSTHLDIREGCTGAEFGYSDFAQLLIATQHVNQGLTVFQNCCNWHNAISGQVGNHIWQSDGLATAVAVP